MVLLSLIDASLGAGMMLVLVAMLWACNQEMKKCRAAVPVEALVLCPRCGYVEVVHSAESA